MIVYKFNVLFKNLPNFILIKRHFNFNKIEFDLKYFCDEKNLTKIKENIVKRKSSGNITLVQQLYKQFGQNEDFLLEINKLPNKTHPKVLEYEKPKIINYHKEKPLFDFEPKEFSEICEKLNLIRTKHLGNVTGHRSYYLLGDLAEIERALINYTVDVLKKHNFELLTVPDILPAKLIERCGMTVNDSRTQVYFLDNFGNVQNQCLSGTAEMALAGYLLNRIIPKDQLPIKLASVSRCYRAETSNIIDERGIYRVHQFNKVEMFGVSLPQLSDEFLEEFRSIQETIFSSLGLHYQILDMSPDELGLPAYRKYDIEAWLPGRKIYGEISSCSNCTDYQSRRLNIKFNNDNKLEYVHTVNGTGCAIPRMLIALVETYQQNNGTICIPDVLKPYMKNKECIYKQKSIPFLKLIK